MNYLGSLLSLENNDLKFQTFFSKIGSLAKPCYLSFDMLVWPDSNIFEVGASRGF